MRCAPPPPSLSWKGSTPTAVSAATKSAASPPRTNPGLANRASGNAKKVERARASAPISAAGTTEAPMKWIKYSRYTGEDFGVDADDLLKALSDFLLQSGFHNPY